MESAYLNTTGVDIVRTTESDVEPDRVLGTGRFHKDDAQHSARWKQALSHDRGDETAVDAGDHDGVETKSDTHGHDHGHGDGHDHRHPPEEFGVDSFVYERHRPFHPERFSGWLRSFPDSVVRAKGHIWIAGRDRYALNLNQAGIQTHVEVNGRWVATLPESQQESYRESHPDLHWDDQWGDREVKLVFIGAEMDRARIVDELDDCLLANEEMNTDWSDGRQMPTATSVSTRWA